MKKIIILFGIVALAACSTKPTTTTPTQADVLPDQVVARIDQMNARPDWLKESEPFTISKGVVSSLGQTEVPGDHRVDAAFRIAENNAKAGISKAIEQKLDYVFQNAEEGTSIDATQARYIGSEVSKITTSTMRVDKRYWEKVVVSRENGSRVPIYRVFVTASMPEGDFKRAVLDAIRKSEGKGGISADFAKKVDQHWDKITTAQTE
ncbi:MAG TPA: hypothetical protein VF412_18660 [Bdellovibrio sp.]|uniref:hypothetical protein n=1 Tax=Bdellovibrio sp. TaxID=28201 RepID=UPI002EE2F176